MIIYIFSVFQEIQLKVLSFKGKQLNSELRLYCSNVVMNILRFSF